jgi:hypothetical protein
MSISKKIFIISSVLLAAVLFFMGIYNLSFKEKNTSSNLTPKSETASNAQNVLDKAKETLGLKNKDKIYLLADRAILSPAVTDDGEKISYYDRSNGSVYKIYLNGDGEEQVENNNFSGLGNIFWSSDQSKVISSFNNNGKTEYSYYDYKTNKATKLSAGISEIAWNNLGDGIAYSFSDSKTGKKTLNIANPDGTNWKKISDVPNKNIIIAPIPQSAFISFWNSPNAFEETALNIVGTVGGNLRKIFSGRFGADYLWSPNGARALVSSSDSKGGSKINLAVINSNGGEYQNLNIPTFASKCVWAKDNKTIYYALPSISAAGLVLPNDYQNKKIITQDTFWKMDVTTGKAERIVDPQDIKSSYDASDLFLSPSEDVLFFINRTDGKLYGINL